MVKLKRPPCESNLFTFKSKKANRAASYCLFGGLCVGVFLGIVYVVYTGHGHWMLGVVNDEWPSHRVLTRWIMIISVFMLYVLWHWFRPIVVSTIVFGLLGMGVGFIAGTLIDKRQQ